MSEFTPKGNRYIQNTGRCLGKPALQNMMTRTELGYQIRQAFARNIELSVDYNQLERNWVRGRDYSLLAVDECGPEYDYAIADAYGARAEYLATVGIIVGEN